jgi:hypothetical protein
MESKLHENKHLILQVKKCSQAAKALELPHNTILETALMWSAEVQHGLIFHQNISHSISNSWKSCKMHGVQGI